MTTADVWLVPSVGFGNVGQLVVDLALANDEYNPAASIDSPYVLPVIGSVPTTEAEGVAGQFVTELDQSVLRSNERLHVIQQRAPLRRNSNKKHAHFLLDTVIAADQQPDKAMPVIVLLHSVHSARQLEASLYVPADDEGHDATARPEFGYVSNAVFDALFPADQHPLLAQLPRLPSSSVVATSSFPQFFIDHASSKGLPVFTLVSFSNGNGLSECFKVFSVLHAVLRLLNIHIVSQPASSPVSSSSSTSPASSAASSSSSPPPPPPPPSSAQRTLKIPATWAPYQL